MHNLKSKELCDAIVLWSGWGTSSFPSRDERRVLDYFGEEAGAGLLAIIKQLETDFYETQAHQTTAGLAEMGRLACEDFRLKHPEADDVIVKTLAWCYSYDFK